MRYATPLLLLLAACQADPGQVILRCDASRPCPRDLVCLSNQTCGPGATADLMPQINTDMLPIQDMSPATGCTVSDATPVGRAWACRVPALATGQAPMLCAAGYKICSAAGADVDQTACKQIAGFAAAETCSSYFGNTGEVSATLCATTTKAHPVYYGCGRVQLGVVYQMGAQCLGFERALDCHAAGSGWSCGTTLAQTSTTVPASVLCCPN